MADLERLSQIAMEIIAYSGVAKSTYIEAARLAREGNFEQAQEQILQGDEVLKTDMKHICSCFKRKRRKTHRRFPCWYYMRKTSL